MGLACSLAVAAVAMVLRFAYVTSPQQWSKADASGWRAPTAPCLRGLACVEVDPATARHEATGTQKVCGHAKLETTQVYAVSRTAILIASRLAPIPSRLYSQPRRAVGAARGRAGGRGAAGGGKGRLNFLYSLALFLDLTIGIIAGIEAVLAISPVVTFRKELAILCSVVLYQARHHPEHQAGPV